MILSFILLHFYCNKYTPGLIVAKVFMICLFYSFFLSPLHRHIREAWELFAAKILSHGEKKKKIGKIRETQVPKFCFTPSACLGIVRWILEDEEFTGLQECAFEKGVWEGEQEIL